MGQVVPLKDGSGLDNPLLPDDVSVNTSLLGLMAGRRRRMSKTSGPKGRRGRLPAAYKLPVTRRGYSGDFFMGGS